MNSSYAWYLEMFPNFKRLSFHNKEPSLQLERPRRMNGVLKADHIPLWFCVRKLTCHPRKILCISIEKQIHMDSLLPPRKMIIFKALSAG